jgi:simple sugar transport system permease protein
VLQVLARGAFGSRYDLGMTLFYATPLMLTGLSVAFALRAGLFNVGAEGQLAVGALAMTCVGVALPSAPAWIAIPLGLLAGFLGGALWGGIAGWLKSTRGSHEVITTIMLNFVAASFVNFVVLYAIKNPATQNPESLDVGPGYHILPWKAFDQAPAGPAFLIAILAAVVCAFIFRKTVLGYELRAVGESPSAAEVAGIRVGRSQFFAMAIAGGIAGLVCAPEIMGGVHRYRLGFSSDFGFMGIAVALLARGNPWGVILSSLFFGALHKGSTELDLETEVITREFALLLQAIVILAACSDGIFARLAQLRPRRTA